MLVELEGFSPCEGLTDSDWRPSEPRRRIDSALSAGQATRRLVKMNQGRDEWTVSLSGNAVWLEPTIQAIGSLLLLEPNWDTYGAPKIDPSFLQSAMDLLCDVMRNDTPAPSVVPTSRGGLQLEWHTKGIDLEVEFVSPTRIRGSFEDRRSGDEWETDLSSDVRRLTQAIALLSRH